MKNFADDFGFTNGHWAHLVPLSSKKVYCFCDSAIDLKLEYIDWLFISFFTFKPFDRSIFLFDWAARLFKFS
ncbi:MAG: hypothetical protein LBR92_03330 [Puniceicoccales bacterium]|jgi:hypothetical protein|nr:hypothetical protein [Puniceicoccales bacterium]